MYWLYYTRCGENGGTRLRTWGHDLDALIEQSETESGLHDDCHIQDNDEHIVYATGLSRELIQDQPPADPGPEWWQDGLGRWHQQPC